MKTLVIAALILAQGLGCESSQSSNQNQTVTIQPPNQKCTIDEFTNCTKEEVRQFCVQDPETIVGFRSPTCLECPESAQCLLSTLE